MEKKTKFLPFISSEAKATFVDYIARKQVIREKAVAWDEEGSDEDIADIIKKLSWTDFCADPGEVVLSFVKEFYANLEGMKDDYAFVRGIWVDFNH